jgi:hypothetical protein
MIKATKKLKSETKKAVVGAIMAAFGFLIALVWRDFIQELINKIIISLNIPDSAAYYNLASALLVTIICVAGIMLAGKYAG